MSNNPAFYKNSNTIKSKYNINIMNNTFNNSKRFLLLIILIFSFFKPIATKKYLLLKKLDLMSEISLIVNGRGNQFILNNRTIEAQNYIQKPSEIIVNGVSQNYSDFIVYNLPKEQNEIILKWNYTLTNCNSMFLNLSNITKIDLSKLDSSKITNMENMFSGCNSLLSINLTDFYISPTINISGMFSYCNSLIYLDFRNFNISNETKLEKIFNGANKELIYCINETKFTSHNIFETYFNPNKNNCSDICFLNSNKIKFTENKTCIINCNESNIYKFEYKNICYQLCPEETIKSPFDNSKCAPKNCPYDYPYLNNNNECVNNCGIDCLLHHYLDEIILNLATNLEDIIIKEKTTNLEDIIIKENNITYTITPVNNNKSNVHIIELNKSNEFYICEEKIKEKYNISKNESLLYLKLDVIKEGVASVEYEFYHPKTHEMLNSEVCSNNYRRNISIPVQLQDNLYQNFLLCNESCPPKYIYSDDMPPKRICECLVNETSKINNNDNIKNQMKIKDNNIINIQNELLVGSLSPLISEVITKNKSDLLIIQKDIIYQITTFENQNQNKNNNLTMRQLEIKKEKTLLKVPSTIKFKECENTLKQYYKINDNDSLVIFKIDYYEVGLLFPIIEYEIYNYKKNEKLNLSICNDSIIDLEYGVNINEKNLFKHNQSSDYYNDICYIYTTEKGTDVTLKDRKNEFRTKNLSLCEKQCEFTDYKYDAKRALCECKIKMDLHLVSEIIENKDQLINIFLDIKNLVNLESIKCSYLLFSKEGLKYNISSYIILLIILTNIILLVFYLLKGKYYISQDIDKIISINENIEMTSNNIILKPNKIDIDDAKKKNNKNKRESIISIKKSKKKKIKKKKILNKNNPPKSKGKNEEKSGKNENKLNIIQTCGEDVVSGKSDRKIEIKNIDNSRNNMNKENINISSLNKELINTKIINNNINYYNDYELNSLIYEEALKLDKRNFFQYYFSLLKRKNLLLFSFYPNNDHNLSIIKISFFLFSFSLNYAVNALFFNDKTMHRIYMDEGIYNFIFQISQIIYSLLISNVIIIIIKFFSLSEKDILKTKKIKEKEKNRRDEKIIKTIKDIMIKYGLFFTFDFILLIFFWIYLGSFSAVYRNTQSHLIKDSFCLSLVYPFLLCLLPAIFRISALNAEKKNKEFIYKIGTIIELII